MQQTVALMLNNGEMLSDLLVASEYEYKYGKTARRGCSSRQDHNKDILSARNTAKI